MVDDNTTNSGAFQYGNDPPKSSNENVHLKILVPSISAGAIIGRGGEAIAQIQRDSLTKVKMSKQNDFYPGTAERVCLIVGNVEGVMRVHDYILNHIREKRDSTTSSTTLSGVNVTLAPCVLPDMRQHGDRSQQMKYLVPNTTAGMIIGKGGAYIREIKECSGAFVQLSQKAVDSNLLERCITVAGEAEQCRKAALMIVQKIAEDPQSNSCPYTSYADVTGPVASAYPTGSPYAQRTPQLSGLVSVPSLPLSSGHIMNAPSATMVRSSDASYLALQTSPSALLLGTGFGGTNSSALSLISPTESLNLSSSTGGSAGTPISLGALHNPFHFSSGLCNPNDSSLSGGTGGINTRPGLLNTGPFTQPTLHNQLSGILPDIYSNSPLLSSGAMNTAAPLSPLNGIYAFPAPQSLYAQSPHSLTSPLGGLSPTGATLLGHTFLSPVLSQPQHLQTMSLQHQTSPQQSHFFTATGNPVSSLDGLSYLSRTSISGSSLSASQAASSLSSHQKYYSGSSIASMVKEVQVPDSCLKVIVDSQSEMQRTFGVSIRIHHSGGVADGNAMLAIPPGNPQDFSSTRLLSVTGTQVGVQGALVRIQQICEQYLRDFNTSGGDRVSVHMRDSLSSPVTTGVSTMVKP